MTLHLPLLVWLASLVAGAAVAFALGVGGVLLRRREGSRLANASMGGVLGVGALAVFYALLLWVQPPGENLRIVLAPLPYTLALGPLLYTYVRARLGLGAPSAWHAVLPAAQALVLAGVGLAPHGVQAWYAARVFFAGWAQLQVALVALSLLVYFALSVRALRSGAASPGAAFAWAARRNRWLRRLLVGVAVAAAVLVVVDLVLPGLSGTPGRAWGAALSVGVYSVVLTLAALAGLVQADVLGQRPTADAATVARPALDDGLAATHADALARFVAAEQPHLDPDLTLGTLADGIGVTDKVLSALLNDHLGTRYADYVNGLRVDEARRRLADPATAHLSVLAVGLDAGFASKSTFNRVFKERTGQTPSAFRAAAEAVTATA